MFRNHNPFNKILEKSHCFFVFGNSRLLDSSKLPPEVQTELDHVTGAQTFSYPHSWGDAFTGLHLFRRIRKTGVNLVSDSHRSPIDTKIQIGAFNIFHKIVSKNNKLSSQTFTQKLLRAVLNSCPELNVISLAVALDPVSEITDISEQGNSLVIVNYSREKALALCEVSRSEWRSSLSKRAQQVLNYIAIHRDPLLNKPGPVLISSLGKLERLPYVDSIYDPESFCMAPTPIYPECINVVTWSFGKQQVMTVCCYRNSGHQALIQSLLHSWEALFQC